MTSRGVPSQIYCASASQTSSKCGEVVEAELGPGFHLVAKREKVVEAEEFELSDHLLLASDIGGIECPEVNDAEMNAADLCGVIVNERDELVGVIRIDGHLFGDFTLDGSVVDISHILRKERIIDGIDVAANADGTMADKACLAGALPADIREVLSSAGHQDVWDELLLGRVLFGSRAGGESWNAGGEELGQILFGVEVKAVERADIFDDFPGNDEYLFFGHSTSFHLGA